MLGTKRACLDGQAQRSSTDIQKRGCFAEIHPAIHFLILWIITRNVVITSQRSNSFLCPSIATPRFVSVAIENASNEFIIADIGEQSDGLNQPFVSVRIVISATPAGHTYFRMQSTLPMNNKDDLTARAIDIRDYFLDQRADDPFL